MVTPLVVDTDIGSNVDDAIALALAARHPELDLRAVSTVSAHPDVRARIVARLLALAGTDDVTVAVGHRAPGDDRNKLGAEYQEILGGGSQTAPHSDAVTLLASLRDQVSLATIGQQTNVAAALARDPQLPRRIAELTVVGGLFAPLESSDGRMHGVERDTNLVLDPPAAVRSLSAGWPVRFVPADVTFGVVWTDAHVDRLRAGDGLCRTLARLVDAWRTRAKPAGAPDDVACWLHDPLGIACVTECEFVGVEQLPVTVMLDQQGLPRTVVDQTEGRRADVVRTVDAAGFADWLVLTLLG